MCNKIFEDQRTNVGYEVMTFYNNFGSYILTELLMSGEVDERRRRRFIVPTFLYV